MLKKTIFSHFHEQLGDFGQGRRDLFAGLVSSVAIIPEVIGFAIIAGVNPMTALLASSVMLLVITVLGGRPAMVSAAAGSMALVMAPLVHQHGLGYMVAATLLTGLLQLICGYLGVHKLVQFIPKTVMLGFVNALAILIFLAQWQQLPGQTTTAKIIVGVTILAMLLLPKIITSVPPALMIIVALTVLAMTCHLGVQQVGDLADMRDMAIHAQLPQVPFTWQTLTIIGPVAVALTIVGLTETLLTLPIVDQMTQTTSDPAREVKAQGVANLAVGLIGGPAGCAMIGQAVINVQSGGRRRLSTAVAGSMLLIFLFGLHSVMVQIPTAALIGIMIVVAGMTFDWQSLRLFRQSEALAASIMVLTVGIVVATHNLALGIIGGTLVSTVCFMVRCCRLSVTCDGDTLQVRGQLFFATTDQLTQRVATSITAHPYRVLDVSACTVHDYSAREALADLVAKYNLVLHQ